MLLLEQKEDDHEILYFDSSNVLTTKYIATTKKFAIIFNNKKQYVFCDVKALDYQRFKLAESQGRAFNKYIKKHKIETTVQLNDVSKILEFINNLKNEKNAKIK